MVVLRWTRTRWIWTRDRGGRTCFTNTAHPKQRSDDTTLATRVVSGAGNRACIRLSPQFTLRPSCVHINTSGSLAWSEPSGTRSLSAVQSASHATCGLVALRTATRAEDWRDRAASPSSSLKFASTTISIDSSTRDAVTAEVGNHRSVFIPNFVDTSICLPRFDRESKSVLFLVGDPPKGGQGTLGSVDLSES